MPVPNHANHDQAPAEVLQQLNSLGKSLQTIRGATDPVRIGLARQELFAAFYKATMNFKEADKPLMIRIMNRYIKVLAFDPANNLLLTNKDAEGMLNYLAFNSELMGQEVHLTDAVRHSAMTDMANQFAAMPLEQKRLLCSASLIWELLESNRNRLTPAQKQQYKSAYYSQIGKNTQSYQTYNQTYNPGSPGSGSKSSTRSQVDMMREHNAKQHMFQMMNEMNMNSHALSLNIIENIGGTGNYWSVVDYQETAREYAKKIRARRPRPYLDINKMVPNSPECFVYPYCQGRGGVSPPVTIRSLKTINFAFSDSLPEPRIEHRT